MATKSKSNKASASAANAAKRALTFLDAAEKAEAADVARVLPIIDQQRATLKQQIADWQNSQQAAKGQEPRTQDGCNLAQLDERTAWEKTRPQIVAPVIERARGIVRLAAKDASNAMEFYNEIQAARAIFPGEELGKLRSIEARTAFDAAFKSPK
jgi:hypothetical protein